jgi:hypothetical protein
MVYIKIYTLLRCNLTQLDDDDPRHQRVKINQLGYYVSMERRTPHCKLAVVKALVETGKVRTTHAARAGASELGLAFSDMLNVVIVSFKEL